MPFLIHNAPIKKMFIVKRSMNPTAYIEDLSEIAEVF